MIEEVLICTLWLFVDWSKQVKNSIGKHPVLVIIFLLVEFTMACWCRVILWYPTPFKSIFRAIKSLIWRLKKWHLGKSCYICWINKDAPAHRLHVYFNPMSPSAITTLLYRCEKKTSFIRRSSMRYEKTLLFFSFFKKYFDPQEMVSSVTNVKEKKLWFYVKTVLCPPPDWFTTLPRILNSKQTVTLHMFPSWPPPLQRWLVCVKTPAAATTRSWGDVRRLCGRRKLIKRKVKGFICDKLVIWYEARLTNS